LLPNILITGTPGTGKSSLVARLKEFLNFNFINVSELVKENGLYESYDADMDTYDIDIDRTLDELEGPMAKGGNIVEHHACAWFPERFFQLVVVLRTNNTLLYDRLAARGYSDAKIEGNMEAELLESVLAEAYESYNENIVMELPSDTEDQVDENARKIIDWIRRYMRGEEDYPKLSEDQDDDDEDYEGDDLAHYNGDDDDDAQLSLQCDSYIQ